MSNQKTDIHQLFFELLQVAVGNRICLSCTPSAKEWLILFDIAEKQSMVGVCFAGVERLHTQQQTPDMDLLMDWLGQAEYIKTRNEEVNKQCVEIQERLKHDGFSNSILKGQGVGSLYSEHLHNLRQSGDIDVWVQGGFEKSLAYANSTCGSVEYDYINAHLPVFSDTEVELHWRVSQLQNLRKNRMFQKWVSEHEDMLLSGFAALPNGQQIIVPSLEFNLFYILLHIYNHEFSEGVGLRQLMDYYFVLQQVDGEYPEAKKQMERFGLKKFASGILWIMKEVFGMQQDQLDKVCKCLALEVNAKEGRFLLNEIMQNGNFGHHDERIKKVASGKMQFLWSNIQHNWHLATHYPSEFFWAPVWLVYHFFWKRSSGKI